MKMSLTKVVVSILAKLWWQQDDANKPLVFREEFIHWAREWIRTALLTAPLNQLMVPQLQDQLIAHDGSQTSRASKNLEELVSLTVQGKPLFRLLEVVRKSIQWISKGKLPAKPEGGGLGRTFTWPSLIHWSGGANRSNSEGESTSQKDQSQDH